MLLSLSLLSSHPLSLPTLLSLFLSVFLSLILSFFPSPSSSFPSFLFSAFSCSSRLLLSSHPTALLWTRSPFLTLSLIDVFSRACTLLREVSERAGIFARVSQVPVNTTHLQFRSACRSIAIDSFVSLRHDRRLFSCRVHLLSPLFPLLLLRTTLE